VAELESGAEGASKIRQELRTTFRSETIKWVVAGVLGLAGIGASWLWGWWAAGGPGGVIGVVPAGAIVAFDAKGGCPGGWQPYEKGWGRFIIGAVNKEDLGKIPGAFARDVRGADLKERPFDLPGGEQQHVLNVQEMPAHTHPVVAPAGLNYPTPNDEYGGKGAKIGQIQTGSAGGGQPHDIMPPYVALWLCRKT